MIDEAMVILQLKSCKSLLKSLKPCLNFSNRFHIYIYSSEWHAVITDVHNKLFTVRYLLEVSPRMSIMLSVFMDQKEKEKRLSLTFHRGNRIKKVPFDAIPWELALLCVDCRISSFMEQIFVSQ